jgi:hypothetical protein
MLDPLAVCQAENKIAFWTKNMSKARVRIVIIRKQNPRFFLAEGGDFPGKKNAYFLCRAGLTKDQDFLYFGDTFGDM